MTPVPAVKPQAVAAPPGNAKTSLRSALGRFATGVTVISAQTEDTHVHCMTVNSFASLSLDPPLILWTLRSRSARYHTFSKTHAFSVSVLAETQIDIAFHLQGPHRSQQGRPRHTHRRNHRVRRTLPSAAVVHGRQVLFKFQPEAAVTALAPVLSERRPLS